MRLRASTQLKPNAPPASCATVARVALAALVAFGGCRVPDNGVKFYDSAAASIKYAASPGAPTELTIEEPCVDCEADPLTYEQPRPFDATEGLEYYDLSLKEAIEYALQHAKVLRDLGGTITTPEALQQTVYDPAIVYSDARFGEEAALSAFDANFAASTIFEKNDREFNNSFIGDGGRLLQDTGDLNLELNKRAATGSLFTVRHLVELDHDNNVGNRFGNPSTAFQSIVEGEVRQPLLRGAGVEFNRAAGPNGEPGAFNGVLLARTRTDISLADFEIAVRDLVANVENAYWDLYFTYRDLDAKKRARDYALETYQTVAAYKQSGSEEGVEENIGQALEQYWNFQADVLDAQAGRTTDGTRTGNGSSGGTSNNPIGVRLAERRLRLILGMPINGGPLLRPADEPTVAPVAFDWRTLVAQSTASRTELRRQRWRVKQLETELVASRNFLLPRLDLVGRYRWRGFGEDLISSGTVTTFADPAIPPSPDSVSPNAYSDLASGDHQEWQVGVELEVPIGFRRAHTAVRNAEHALARARAILSEQKRDVVFGLTNATADVERAYAIVRAQYNRFDAAQRQIAALKEAEKAGRTAIDLVLDAQRRALDTEILYHQATVDYALALRNVYFEAGALLDYCGVYLTEGASPPGAYRDAWELAGRRTEPIDYVARDRVVSKGPVK